MTSVAARHFGVIRRSAAFGIHFEGFSCCNAHSIVSVAQFDQEALFGFEKDGPIRA
jgi:hypothetical protein